MGPMGSEECITEGITELPRVVQYESYGFRGVHHGRHHCELSEECITEGITVNCQV